MYMETLASQLLRGIGQNFGLLLLSTEANDGQFLRNLGEFAVKQPHQNRLEL
jgi:hypothetical protein